MALHKGHLHKKKHQHGRFEDPYKERFRNSLVPGQEQIQHSQAVDMLKCSVKIDTDMKFRLGKFLLPFQSFYGPSY
jgi:hypothetical protein